MYEQNSNYIWYGLILIHKFIWHSFPLYLEARKKTLASTITYHPPSACIGKVAWFEVYICANIWNAWLVPIACFPQIKSNKWITARTIETIIQMIIFETKENQNNIANNNKQENSRLSFCLQDASDPRDPDTRRITVCRPAPTRPRTSSSTPISPTDYRYL